MWPCEEEAVPRRPVVTLLRVFHGADVRLFLRPVTRRSVEAKGGTGVDLASSEDTFRV